MAISPAAATLRAATLALIVALIVLVVAWTLSAGMSGARGALALSFTVPLLAPLHGLIHRNRRTYAWATLCVIPYFVLGLTEAIANPGRRGWAGACLALAFLLFGTLIGYLRVTRGTDRSGTPRDSAAP